MTDIQSIKSHVDCIVKGKPVVVIINFMGMELKFSFKDEICICSPNFPYWKRTICDFEEHERKVDHREWWILTDTQRSDTKCISHSFYEGCFWFDVRSEYCTTNHNSTCLNINIKLDENMCNLMYKQAEVLVEQLKEVSFLKFDEKTTTIAPLGRPGHYSVYQKKFKVKRDRAKSV